MAAPGKRIRKSGDKKLWAWAKSPDCKACKKSRTTSEATGCAARPSLNSSVKESTKEMLIFALAGIGAVLIFSGYKIIAMLGD